MLGMHALQLEYYPMNELLVWPVITGVAKQCTKESQSIQTSAFASAIKPRITVLVNEGSQVREEWSSIGR